MSKELVANLKSLLGDLKKEYPAEGWLPEEIASAMGVPLVHVRMGLRMIGSSVTTKPAHVGKHSGRPPLGYCLK